MKFSFLGNIISKVLDVYEKKSRNGEKQQEIEEQKLTHFDKYLGYIVLALLIICFIGAVFPSLAISDWFYNMFEKGFMYMIN